MAFGFAACYAFTREMQSESRYICAYQAGRYVFMATFTSCRTRAQAFRILNGRTVQVETTFVGQSISCDFPSNYIVQSHPRLKQAPGPREKCADLVLSGNKL